MPLGGPQITNELNGPGRGGAGEVINGLVEVSETSLSRA